MMCDNKLQITIFSIVEAYKKIPLVRKKEKKEEKNICRLRIFKEFSWDAF